MTFVVPPQRFRPLLPNNYTTKSIASLFQEPMNKLNNLTKEIKAQIVPAAIDAKDKVLNVFGINSNLSTTTTPINNAQQEINNDNNQQPANQNVPPPPLANSAQRRLQPDHIESAQNAPKPLEPSIFIGFIFNIKILFFCFYLDQAGVDNRQLLRSSNNSLNDNRYNKQSELAENDDEERQLQKEENGLNNLQENLNPVKQEQFDNNNQLLKQSGSLLRGNRKEYRSNNRRKFQPNRNFNPQQQRINNGEEIDDIDNNEEYQRLRKRNIV